MSRVLKTISNNASTRVGETTVAKNGMKMTIIAYRGCKDVDILFEDGYLSQHKPYGLFKAGTVFNPNAYEHEKQSRIGLTQLSRSGMNMTIIEYRDVHDIDVKFEDGTIVTNKTFHNFQAGYIGHPSYSKNDNTARSKISAKAAERVGQTSVSKSGETMTLIAYRSATDVDVRFEDGTVVNTSYSKFITGEKTKNANPRSSWDKTGESRYTSSGILCTVKNYRSATDIDVEFEDGEIVKNVTFGQFKLGIKHPYFRGRSLHNEWHIGKYIVTGLAYLEKDGRGEFYCTDTETGDCDIKTIQEIMKNR